MVYNILIINKKNIGIVMQYDAISHTQKTLKNLRS